MEDSSSFTLPFLSVLGLIIVSAFFSGSETGLTGVTRAKIHKLKMEGNRRAILVSKLRENKERLIGAILLGNNVVNIAASAIATALAIRYVGEEGVIYATGIMTVLVLVFAEVLPKTYAVRHAEQVALAVAPLFVIITKILSPFTIAVQVIVDKVLALFSMAPPEEMSGVEVLRGAVDLYHEEGNVLTDDKDMLSGVFDLGETEVREIMIHRSDMVAVNIDEPAERIIDFMANCSHSRLPVWHHSPTNIIGLLHSKDVFKAVQNRKDGDETIDIKSLVRDPWFVPETITLKNQLKAFQEKQKHIAMIVDEFGSVSGLISLEDIIEEVVGEIEDEHDLPVEKKIQRFKNGSYNVDGDISIRDLNRELGWNLSDEDANTVAGYIMAAAQRIPEVDDVFEIGEFMFKVLAKDKTQITRVKIRKLTEPTEVEKVLPEGESEEVDKSKEAT
ncbi:HlyC/CorC family transporter [Emcibacter sp.]|uniref:HlyC/CorC family transporter n=1 Tax=Emcibacter sp. TaxID=1979954 RepID=UPI003A93BD37